MSGGHHSTGHQACSAHKPAAPRSPKEHHAGSHAAHETRLLAALPGIVTCDPTVLHGCPVFAGTAVALETLLDYRRAGAPLYEFLIDFPSVRKSHARRAWAWMDTLTPAGVHRELKAAEVHPAARHPHHPHSRAAR